MVRYGDHYAERVVPDEEWIAFSAERQLVAISHDRNIRSDPVAIQSAMERGARLFIIRGKNLTASEKASLLIEALHRIDAVLTEQRSAFIAVVSRRSLPKGMFRPVVEVRLTYDDWSRGRRRLTEDENLPP